MSTYFKEDICQDKREMLESDSGTSLFLQSEPTYFMLKSKCFFIGILLYNTRKKRIIMSKVKIYNRCTALYPHLRKKKG